MGASSSKAEVYINTCINAGISVVNKTVASAETRVFSSADINVEHCDYVDISHLDFSQTVQLNMEAAAKALNNTGIENDIREKIKAAAESGAEAAIGFADSTGKIVEDITNTLTEAISNECSGIASGLADLIVSVHVTYCSEAHISYLTTTQRANMISKAFSSSDNLNKAKQSLVEEVEAASKSKAKGWDITWIVLGIVAVIFLVVFGGFDVVAKSLLSVSFWFLLGLAATCFGGWMCISTFILKWPSSIPKATDSKEVIDKKAARNKSVLKWGEIVLGVGSIVSIITGFIFVKQHSSTKKIIVHDMPVSTTPQSPIQATL